MSDEEHECPPCPAGLPGWLATFADLMSLLMCFFVLLLSFSEMDVLKFKQLAGSMREAFGVQNQIKVEDVPKGTSIIAQEFSPGRPEPTPLNEVRQMTVNNDMNTLDIRSEEGENEIQDQQASEAFEEMQKEQEREAEEEAVEFAAALAKEIGQGSIEVESEGRKIIIRLKEQGSFDSGRAELKFAAIPVLAKIRDMLLTVQGKVAIEGHTDNIPYKGRRFESNWDLSTARALAVAHELFGDPRIKQDRFRILGYAATKPLTPNETRAQRGRNRRVEIVVQKGEDQELLKRLQASDPEDIRRENQPPKEVF
ncbi:flagellar motor protein MotB [Pontibacterium sp. N1Y112]|uniref:Flagellar motor protein MotB n=1 Tax=Pontibacterium sinense TaxID=2781979 RepID=A0A8J7FEU5_9GAMM|nr:flagellar motor protein MotB [Pontibacterium sinense]MBE9395888.1 flagellar motor protein MotB [Pontibacterium sinense]